MAPGMKIRVRLGPKLLRVGLSENSLRLEEQILELFSLKRGVKKTHKTPTSGCEGQEADPTKGRR